MLEGFSAALSGLRRESGLNQRRVSSDLGISQALLSHYENGIREPGLDFVVRACEYYGVSADYLLGRTSIRDGSAVSGVEDEASVCKKRLCNTLSAVFEHADKFGGEEMLDALTRWTSLQCYKILRLIPSAPVKKPDKRVWAFSAGEKLAEAQAFADLAAASASLDTIDLAARYPERHKDALAVIEASERLIYNTK